MADKKKLNTLKKKPIGIAIASKDNLEYLKLCLLSLKKHTKGDYSVYIVDDASTDGTTSWIIKHKKEYNVKKLITYEKNKGLMVSQNESVALVDEDIFIIAHADMYFCNGWDYHFKEHVKPGRFTCLTRIEPPVYQAEECKIQESLGDYPNEFEEKGFNLLVKFLQYKNKKKLTYGQFAPYGGMKEEFMKHQLDRNIGRQTHDETDLFIRLLINGFELRQTWGGYVYHFGGRGTKLKGDNLNPGNYDEDYKKIQVGSFRNFFRKWSCAPIHNKWSYPEMPRLDYNADTDKVEALGVSLCVLMKNEENLIYNFLSNVEPYFNEIIIVNDNSTDNSLKEIERYKKDTIKAKDIDGEPLNYYFDSKKIKIYDRALNKDFAAQKNFALSKTKNDWIMHLDVDEDIEPQFWWSIADIIKGADERKISILGFPRTNYIDNVQTKVYPDHQFRLHRKDIKWEGDVHEKPIGLSPETTQIIPLHIIHKKSKEQHNKRNIFYNTIKKGSGQIISNNDSENKK